MSRAKRARGPRRGGSCLVLALGLLVAGLADDARAADAGRLAAEADRLSSPPSAAPLEKAADRLGDLVREAREHGASAEVYGRLAAAAERLRGASEAARRALEGGAGESEAALEAVLRSEDWQRLDYVDATLGFWGAWADVGRAQAVARDTPERRKLLQRAEQGFRRATAEVRMPERAASSLLGLGIVRRELGDADGAREALEQLERQLSAGAGGPLLVPVRVELARIAFEDGDVARGRALATKARESGATRAQDLALAQLEARALLVRLRAGKAGPDEASEAAELLRRLAGAGGDEAGAAAARAASALQLEYRRELGGRDAGPAGALLDAEAAFDAKDWAAACAGYARALAGGSALPGVDLGIARYKYAVALSETGARREALDELALLFAGGATKVDARVRAPAARLEYALAAALAAEAPSDAAEARAVEAAQRLVAVAPGAPEADEARVRAARAGGARVDAASRIRLLEAVPPSSAAYPAARVDLVRLRAEEVARLEEAGREATPAGKAAAKALGADTEAVASLVAGGRLARDPARDATLAVLRAKAAALAGEPPAAVLEHVERASAQAGLDDAGRRTLFRLRLRALADAGRTSALAAELDARSDTDLRRDFALWRDAWERLASARGEAGAELVRGAERLVAAAPETERPGAELLAARALLRAGRAEEAARRTGALVEADPAWGDAWVLHARALDATRDAAAAARAWETVSAGVAPETPLWLESELARAAALGRAGDEAARCGALARARARSEASAAARGRLADAAKGCAEGGR